MKIGSAAPDNIMSLVLMRSAFLSGDVYTYNNADILTSQLES